MEQLNRQSFRLTHLLGRKATVTKPPTHSRNQDSSGQKCIFACILVALHGAVYDPSANRATPGISHRRAARERRRVPDAEQFGTVGRLKTKRICDPVESGVGFIAFARKAIGQENPEWYERVSQWDKALPLWTSSPHIPPQERVLGRLRCLVGLNRFREASLLSERASQSSQLRDRHSEIAQSAVTT